MVKVKREIIRVRMAPSPTGFLHVGSARTALFNWLFAKHGGGQFILRIEDTDLERSTKKYEEDIISGLEWLGIKWDEFYRQSERTKIYTKYIQKLLDSGKAFWCYHTETELEDERKKQMENKELPRHVCEYKKQKNSGDKKEKGIIRLAVDENSDRKIKFSDLIRGDIEFEEKLLGDFSIAKDINIPLYNFAVVVDDADMKISHVIRGEDHISNTPKQLLIFEALGQTAPKYAHLPLILGEDKSKLSKRHGAVSVIDYRSQGYLADSLVNFLGTLGCTYNNVSEVLTKNELIEKFAIENVHKSGAVFDIKKLNWLNAQYIKMENDRGIVKLAQPFVEKEFSKQPEDLLLKLTPLFRERLEYLDQIKEFHYFFKTPEYEAGLLVWRKSDAMGAQKALEIILQDEKITKEQLDKIAEQEFGGDRGAVYWPLRVALSGEKFSADPLEIISIISESEAITRIKIALEKLRC